MGSQRLAELKDGNGIVCAEIWTRGGEEGVVVEHKGDSIFIPHEMLVAQVGNAMKQKAISRLEGMTGEEAMKHFASR